MSFLKKVMPSKAAKANNAKPSSTGSTSSDELRHEHPTEETEKQEMSVAPVHRANDVLQEVKLEDDGDDLKHKRPELHQTVTEERRAQDAEIEYPKSWKLGIIFIGLCLAVFCMALDNTIIATAIPKITDQFNSIDDVAWYGSAYLLTTCAFQLFFGRLYTFFSIKWTFLTAVGIFELGSLVCGVAPTSTALIIGRAIAGLGSAGIFSGGILIVAHTVPLEKRPIYTGFVGAMYGIASVAGPLMGGAFTDNLTWRWCFYINLPIGAVTIFFIAVFLKLGIPSESAGLSWREKIARLDLLGTAVFVPAIICLLLALQWGGNQYEWSNWRMIVLFVIAGLLVIAFLAIQWWKQDNGTVPPRIFFQRSVCAGSWFAACLGASFFTLIYYIPIWFQAIKGTSATHSGINSLPLILGVTIMSIVSGIGTTVLGYYTPWIYASTIFISIGCGLITTWKVHTAHPAWIGYQAIAGMGFGMGIQNPLIAVQTVLPLKDVPIGTATIMFSQTLGGALFIAVAQNVFLNQLVANAKAYVPDFPSGVILSTGATTLRDAVPPQYLDAVLFAYNKTMDETFYVATALGCMSVFGAAFMEWKSVKGKKIEMGGA